MAEVKKRKIVIASVLKPVNDTRMTEKIGWSLADTRRFEIHIIGFPGKVTPHPNVLVHTLPFFKRLSFKRLLAPWAILRKISALKPDLLIITTHELLAASILAKAILGIKVIYDVQENYYRNIRFTRAFPFPLRLPIALYVRIKEILSAGLIDHFFVAEKAYVQELSFASGRHTVLENKLVKPSVSTRFDRIKNQLLFSGTLAESTGVFKAIEVAVKLHELDPSVRLILAGHCSQQSTLSRIKKEIAIYPFITLIGGNYLIPHEQIVEHIQLASAGVIAYPNNPSTYHSIPTKLFEYLGLKLPILLTRHPEWESLCQPYSAAIPFDPERIDAEAILIALNTSHFYSVEPRNVFWDSEQPKLIRQVYQLLN
jgi:glycosyltransferase involved in cell wall biosynthesis